MAGNGEASPRKNPRQNGLAVALRELGRIERTLFILDWLQSVERAAVSTPGRTKARPGTLWRGRYSSTGSAKSVIGASSSSAIGPAASTW